MPKTKSQLHYSYDIPCPMKPSKPCPTQEVMKHMPHLMEKHYDVMVSHQRGCVGCGLSEISDHRVDWVAPLSVGKFMARYQRPHSDVRELPG